MEKAGRTQRGKANNSQRKDTENRKNKTHKRGENERKNKAGNKIDNNNIAVIILTWKIALVKGAHKAKQTRASQGKRQKDVDDGQGQKQVKLNKRNCVDQQGGKTGKR